ncbi:arabinan endo-1,5-alpha-L-arabinosidase [Lewinella aquimaris]|uniref:Arabinan endo-1,5-alpha-L-arabinosidase n=2 Tax=Neolewinella aquimaris TaxID=1835722 RepID=A0A840E6T1_9BACT|nr:arabinan endo-1,5-alpha-L-arabinosidase [Neolewinella aquimaris]MBB4080750.1 arabinan endo-1,5-alpha-L-arabinosidase [Neolewinella aquimaris]
MRTKMHTLFGCCLLLALLWGGNAGAQNIADIRVHDPVVIREGNTYHLFCTGRGIAHFTSPDLENWTEAAPVFPEKPTWTDTVVPDFGNHIWAPDVLLHNGLYYLFYSVSAFAKNTSAIGVATGKTLDPDAADYGWTDHGIVIRSYPNRDLWNAIDPNVIFDEAGTPWMSFGSFWNGLKLTKLDGSLTRLADDQEWHTIARRERSFELGDYNPGDAALEAPFIFKKGDWYYQFLSWDLCCRGENSTYKVVVGRSSRVEGPYFDREGKNLFYGGGTLVLQGNKNWYGAGHCSVYTFDGTDYMFFHAYDASDNARPKLGMSPISWTADGWPQVEPLN